MFNTTILQIREGRVRVKGLQYFIFIKTPRIQFNSDKLGHGHLSLFIIKNILEFYSIYYFLNKICGNYWKGKPTFYLRQTIFDTRWFQNEVGCATVHCVCPNVWWCKYLVQWKIYGTLLHTIVISNTSMQIKITKSMPSMFV